MSKRWEPIRLRGVGGMPQYEAGSDGKCFNIRQGVSGFPLLVKLIYSYASSMTGKQIVAVKNGL